MRARAGRADRAALIALHESPRDYLAGMMPGQKREHLNRTSYRDYLLRDVGLGEGGPGLLLTPRLRRDELEVPERDRVEQQPHAPAAEHALQLRDDLGVNINYRFSEKYDDSPRTEYTWNTATAAPIVFAASLIAARTR